MANIDELLERLTISELKQLAAEIPAWIEKKSYAVGYKDGSQDAKQSENDKRLFP